MDWKNLFSTIREVLNTQFFQIGDTPITLSTVITVLVIILVTMRGSRALRRAVERRLERRGGSAGTVGAASKLLHYAVLVIGFSVAAQTAGINLTALFAAGAVFAVGLGFAMQTIAQNFVSGIILMVERSIGPGDVLDVEGRAVKVMRMGIRATVVQTRDGEDIIMPNSTLVQSSVTNYTMNNEVTRTRFQVGVVYSADMKLVRDTLLEVGKAFDESAANTEPEVLMIEFGDNSVIFELAVWIADAWRLRSLRSKVADQIWWAFKEQGITIAFPQLDVHFDPPVASGFEALAGRAA
jgi:small-conductance mechanosensitive channel